MEKWLLVAGDFTPLGGMDRANHALAAGLSRRGFDVSVVAHRVWPDLCGRVRTTIVPRPAGSHLIGAPLLDSAARRASRGGGGRVVANGGNTSTSDVTWIHYLHAAHAPRAAGAARHLRTAAAHRYYLRGEQRALDGARFVVCNSRRTARDVAQAYGVSEDRLRVVYYGSEPAAFKPVTSEERHTARQALGLRNDTPVALFVGALGDRRKGFDRLFEAWTLLSADGDWDVQLVVAGAGGELDAWRARSAQERQRSMHFLGFREDIPQVMAAADVVVHPARYEAYGLAVHEAICRGLPAVVSANAGVAEQISGSLAELFVEDVESAAELAGRIRRWRTELPRFADAAATLSAGLRSRTWDDMAADFIDAVSD